MLGRKSPPKADQATEIRGFDAYDVCLGDSMRGERATMGKSLLDVQRELKITSASATNRASQASKACLPARQTRAPLGAAKRSQARGSRVKMRL